MNEPYVLTKYEVVKMLEPFPDNAKVAIQTSPFPPEDDPFTKERFRIDNAKLANREIVIRCYPA